MNLGLQRTTLSPQLEEVAKCLARECAGLPLGIITVARCMREVNDVSEWRNAVLALEESKVGLLEMEEKVFQVLKFSYNRLNDTNLQRCFLYCALYPEDYKIQSDRLIQYFIDEGLIERMRNRQAEFDKVHTMLNKLVNNCLLESDVRKDCVRVVKMRDLVRDMAIKIMGPQFMVKARMQMNEMPEEQEWSKDVERVSLMGNEIEEITSATSPRCLKLLTLLLSYNSLLKRIDTSFFDHMPSLQVLDLSLCGEIKELPDSVSNLKSLSALVLRRCWKLLYVPSLANLTSLKRLDLFDSGIRKVPHGLEMLFNLTYLNLNDAKNLEVFPSGILVKLSRLEYLKFGIWGVKIKGEELRGLKRVSTFQGRVVFDDNVKGFKEYVMSRRRFVGPKCYYKFVLDGNKHVEQKYNSKHSLNEVRMDHWSFSKRTEDVETLEALLEDVESLEIFSCEFAGSLSCGLGKATCNLKRCCIDNCQRIECLVSLPAAAESTVFSFLKSLTINKCNKIKNLFETGLLSNLRSLEEIHVSRCYGLEEIIAATSEEDEESSNNNNHCTLPKLRTLSLIYLPKLKSICAGTMVCDALEVIEVVDCRKLGMIPLSQPPSSLQSIRVRGRNREELLKSMEWDHQQYQIE